MKTILAIGGAVVKTAWDEIKEVAQCKMFDVLIHNGGSLFHDFQRATEDLGDKHSHRLDDLLKDYSINSKASELVWRWIDKRESPANSLTNICVNHGIKVLMFTGFACDFWQLFGDRNKWARMGESARFDFDELCGTMSDPFHFICMGSAVIHPEVFTKALAVVKPEEFKADVVDFLDMHRPRTEVARYGEYFLMKHKEFLKQWILVKS